MSTNNTHPNTKAFSRALINVLTDARRGTPPPTAAEAIAGLDLIKNLYKQFPATEQSAKTALDLAKVLFYDFPHFREAYEAAAK
jgi:hypothetical protein